MIIENLKRENLESYKNLIDVCFGNSNNLEWYEKNYTDKNEYEILVAKDKDKIIGSITFYKINLFTFSFQPALEIFNVAVLPEYRGKKIAKKIFEYVVKYAKENGYKSIYLTCLNDAYSAHHLYENIGFKKASSIKYNLYLDDISE